MLLALLGPSYSSITCRSVTRKTSSYMRSLSSEGRSKKRNGWLCTGLSSSKSSSCAGDGAREGSVDFDLEVDGVATALGFALDEAAALVLRLFAIALWVRRNNVKERCTRPGVVK